MGHDHIVSQLLKAGAQVDAARHVSFTQTKKAFTEQCWFQDGATALFKASHKGYASVVGELLKYNPSLELLTVSIKFSSPV